MSEIKIRTQQRFYVSLGEVGPDGAELKLNIPT